jgi:hypothetical protein
MSELKSLNRELKTHTQSAERWRDRIVVADKEDERHIVGACVAGQLREEGHSLWRGISAFGA